MPQAMRTTTLLPSCYVNGWLDAVKDCAVDLISSGKSNTHQQIMGVLKEESEERWIEKAIVKRVVNGLSSGILVIGGKASGGECEGSEQNRQGRDRDLSGSYNFAEAFDQLGVREAK